MIKALFFTAALLAPGLACGANPSADLSVQIVPAGSTPAVPAAAQAAGFTTLAYDADFSQPFYATQSNWLDCGARGGSQNWHSGMPGISSKLPCDVNQGTDPVTGEKTLIFTYQPSYDHLGSGLENQVSMQTLGSLTFPNMYLEVISRADGLASGGSFGSGIVEGLWTWQTTTGLELDIWEGSTCCAGSFPGGGVSNGNAGNWSPKSGGIVWSNYGNNHLPAGYDMTQYHKYAELLTSDGASKVYVCTYVDDILQEPCTDMNVSGAQFAYRNWLIMSMGNGDDAATGHLYHMYNKSVRVWSCPSWNGQPGDPSHMCNGTSLYNNNGLTYWH